MKTIILSMILISAQSAMAGSEVVPAPQYPVHCSLRVLNALAGTNVDGDVISPTLISVDLEENVASKVVKLGIVKLTTKGQAANLYLLERGDLWNNPKIQKHAVPHSSFDFKIDRAASVAQTKDDGGSAAGIGFDITKSNGDSLMGESLLLMDDTGKPMISTPELIAALDFNSQKYAITPNARPTLIVSCSVKGAPTVVPTAGN